MGARYEVDRMVWLAHFREELFAAWWDFAMRGVPFWRREFYVSQAAYEEAQRLDIKRWGGMFIQPDPVHPKN